MEDTTKAASRRDFLKLATTAAPAAAVAAVAGGTAEEASAAQPTALGLRKTEHVRKYLESARF
ncbi:MAG: twin-arginine translocation pathway signal protein [Paracoccaceae bacterium]